MQPIPTPPHCVTQLLRWFCPANLLEEIEGDLFQKFERDVNQFGVRKAKRRFTWNVIRYFRPGIVMRNKVTLFNNNNMLITNHFRFAWRNLFRHKVFSAINIAGLTLGMAVCMIITNYVLFEKSYDSFHEKGKNIFRVTYSRFIDNKFQFQKAQTFPAVGETLKASVPEVENFIRIFPATTYVEAILSVDGNDQKSYSESSIYAVDSTFLKIFSFPLIRGNANTALIGEKKFIISSTIANKFFGSEDVLGKTIHWEGMGDWTVSGVFKDLPENSHMKFNLITSWMNVYGERSAWNWDGFYTYLLLKPNADLSKTETLIQQVLDEKLNERPDANRVKSTFQLQPLRDIHLTSHLDGEIQANGNQTLVFTLQIIAILILSLALINYYNLSLARIIKRVKEAICITCTMMAGKQLEFIHNKKLGIDRNNLLVLSMPEHFTTNKMQAFKNELKSIAGVDAVSNSSFRIGGGYWKDWYFVEKDGDMVPIELYEVFSDDELFKTLGINVLKGRTFRADIPYDSGAAFVINETAAHELGWDDPIGKRIYTHPEDEGKWDGTVVGLVADVNISPLYEKIQPLVMRLPWQNEYPEYFVYVRYKGEAQSIIKSIEEMYNETLPGYPLAYRFVDEFYNSQHRKESKAFASLQFGTYVIALISLVGIFSLAAYISIRRMKEFGIRKVLGATMLQIAQLHLSYFARLLFIASVISIPLAFWLVRSWLDTFAYRTDLTISPFILSIGAMALLVIVSAGYSSWKSGRMNPVDVIKME